MVGSPGSTVNGHTVAGTAYIFKNTAGTWSTTPIATLTPADTIDNGNFGSSVAITPDGKTIVIGAYGQSSAYVYTAPTENAWSGTPTQAAELQESPTYSQPGDYLGWSVAVSSDGTTVLIGAKQHGTDNTGSAFVFSEQNSDWNSTPSLTETTELTASASSLNSYFGSAVSISGDGTTALVGSPGLNTTASNAYVYNKSASGWNSSQSMTESQTLTPSDSGTGDNFGQSLALSSDGNTAVIGAPGHTVNGHGFTGAAYVYKDSGSGLMQTFETIATPAGADFDEDGSSVALAPDGSSMLIGSQGHSVNGNLQVGIAYRFIPTNDGSNRWLLSDTYSPASDTAAQKFGFSVALVNNAATGNAFVGAPGSISQAGASAAKTKAQNQAGANGSGGSAYLFKASTLTVTSFSPTTQGEGGKVTIKGTGLQGAKVALNGVDLQILSNSKTSISVNVPLDAVSGYLLVTNPNLPGNSQAYTSSPLTVAAPVINSVPKSAKAGDTIAIKGKYLAGVNQVTFGGGVQATSFLASSTTVLVVVPSGATTGPITVNAASGQATSKPFTVLP